jgi:hypothetical protein
MSEHVKALEKVRAKLVDNRRVLVDVLDTSGQRSAFNDLQNTIEQIDKAIADEKRNAPPATPKGSKGGGYK